jgi:hypothetical protein
MKTMLSSRRYHYFSSISTFLVTLVLVVGMIGCGTTDLTQPFEIQDWKDLNNIRDNLNGSYILMHDLDSATAEAVEVSMDGATTWTPTAFVHSAYADLGPETRNVDLSAYKGQKLMISWVISGRTFWTDGWWIDHIVIGGS